MGHEERQRLIAVEILRALARMPQCDEGILLKTVGLTANATDGDARVALDFVSSQGWATAVTGTWGNRKWRITDLGRGALAEQG